MATKAQKVRLGAFLVVGGVLTVVVAALFTGIQLTERSATYHVRVPDAEGLEVGAAVKVRGVRVGTVGAMRLFADDRESVRVELDIDRDVQINGDAKAYLEFAGVTGLRIVNIRGGTGTTPPYKPGSHIEYGETILEQLPDRAAELLSKATALLESTDELVVSLGGVAKAFGPERVDAVFARTERLLAELAETGARLNQIIAGAQKPIARTFESTDRILVRVDHMAAELDGLARSIHQVVADLGGVVKNNDDQVRATLYNLRQASESFEMLGRELRSRPNRLLFGGSPPDRKLP